MCMITTVAVSNNEASEGTSDDDCSVFRGNGRAKSLVSTNGCSTRSDESPRYPTVAPISPSKPADAVRIRAYRDTKSCSTSSEELRAAMKLKQRIGVIVRIRPLEGEAAPRITRVLNDGRTLAFAPASKGAKKKLDQGRLRDSRKELELTFDRVLGEGAAQAEVYDEVKACVRLPFSGINACIFAYGQTGSGKTYSMIGDVPTQKGNANAGLASSLAINGNATVPSRANVSPDILGKHRTVTTTGEEINNAGDHAGGKDKARPTGADQRRGVIPRAVEDIFAFVRQGGIGQKIATTPTRSTSAGHDFCEPQGDHRARATTAGAKRGTTAAPLKSTYGPRTGHSTPSSSRSGTSSAKDSEDWNRTEEVPSAAHWPLVEPMVFVPRDRPRPTAGHDSPSLAASQTRAALADSDGLGIARMEGGGGGEDEGKGERERQPETGRGDSSSTNCQCSVECSYMQVYNGCVYDLLSPHEASQQRPLPVLTSARPVAVAETEAIGRVEENAETSVDVSTTVLTGKRSCSYTSGRESSRAPGGHVIGLSVHAVDNAEQVMELLRQGNLRHRTRSTELNNDSSRSHSIVEFTISSTRPETSCSSLVAPAKDQHPAGNGGAGRNGSGDRGSPIVVTTRAKLSLVDLAGSERGRTEGGPCRAAERRRPLPRSGQRDAQERERLQINSSLSALSNCISCLGETGRTHVPFRDNPLTRLLQNSLVGGQTVVIATIRASADAQEESISTLKFAARCMRVVAKHRVNEVVSDAVLLERARRQISALRRRLAEVERAAGCPSSSPPCRRSLSLLTTRTPTEAAKTPPPRPLPPPSPPPPLPRPASSSGVNEDESGSSGRGDARYDGTKESVFEQQPGTGSRHATLTMPRRRGQRHGRRASLVAAPTSRSPRPDRQPGGELNGDLGNRKGSSLQGHVVNAEYRKGKGVATAGTMTHGPGETSAALPLEPVSRTTVIKARRHPLRTEEVPLSEDAFKGQPGSSPSPPLSRRRTESMCWGGVTKTPLDARRDCDLMVCGRAAAVADAADAADAAAASVTAVLAAAGGGRLRRTPAHGQTRQELAAVVRDPAVERNESAGGPGRSSFREPRNRKKTRKRNMPAVPCSASSGVPSPITISAKHLPAPRPTMWSAGERRMEENSLATEALIERFSSREDELLRELDTWKSRCKSLEEGEAVPDRSNSSGNSGGCDDVSCSEKEGVAGSTTKDKLAFLASRSALSPTLRRAEAPGPPQATTQTASAIRLEPPGNTRRNDSSFIVNVGTTVASYDLGPDQQRSTGSRCRGGRAEVLEDSPNGCRCRLLPEVLRKPCAGETADALRHAAGALKPLAGIPSAAVMTGKRVARGNRAETPAVQSIDDSSTPVVGVEADAGCTALRERERPEQTVGGETDHGCGGGGGGRATTHELEIVENEPFSCEDGRVEEQRGYHSLTRSRGAEAEDERGGLGGDDQRVNHESFSLLQPMSNTASWYPPEVRTAAVPPSQNRRLKAVSVVTSPQREPIHLNQAMTQSMATVPENLGALEVRSPDAKAGKSFDGGSDDRETTSAGLLPETESVARSTCPGVSLPCTELFLAAGNFDADNARGNGDHGRPDRRVSCERHGPSSCRLHGAHEGRSVTFPGQDKVLVPPVSGENGAVVGGFISPPPAVRTSAVVASGGSAGRRSDSDRVCRAARAFMNQGSGEDEKSPTPGRVIPTLPQATGLEEVSAAPALEAPCERHLLPDCILCKMRPPIGHGGGALSDLPVGIPSEPDKRQGALLGRSTSLPALGSTASASEAVGGHAKAAKIVRTKGCGDTTGRVPASNACRCGSHGLLDCFLCEFGSKSPTVAGRDTSTGFLLADDEDVLLPVRSRLSSRTSQGGEFRAGGASRSGVRVDQPWWTDAGAGVGSGLEALLIDPTCSSGEGPGHAMLFGESHRAAGADTDVRNSSLHDDFFEDARVAPSASSFGDNPSGSAFAEESVIRGFGNSLTPLSGQSTSSRGGPRRRNSKNRVTDHGTALAGGSGGHRTRGEQKKRSRSAHYGKQLAGLAARVVPVSRGPDLANIGVRRDERRHHSRVGSPGSVRRMRKLPKPKSNNCDLSSKFLRIPGIRGDEKRGAHARAALGVTRIDEMTRDSHSTARATAAALAILQ